MRDTDAHGTPIAPRGEPLFAALFLLGAAALLSQFPSQTSMAEGTKLVAQPAFWPAIGVGGMTLFGGLYYWSLPRHRPRPHDRREGRKWLGAFEYAGWFLAYVFAVPVIGYLPASLIFLPVLCWRMGYRSRRMLLAAAAVAVAIVVAFKGLLDVKIPGGVIYELLPDPLRTFFVLNL